MVVSYLARSVVPMNWSWAGCKLLEASMRQEYAPPAFLWVRHHLYLHVDCCNLFGWTLQILSTDEYWQATLCMSLEEDSCALDIWSISVWELISFNWFLRSTHSQKRLEMSWTINLMLLWMVRLKHMQITLIGLVWSHSHLETHIIRCSSAGFPDKSLPHIRDQMHILISMSWTQNMWTGSRISALSPPGWCCFSRDLLHNAQLCTLASGQCINFAMHNSQNQAKWTRKQVCCILRRRLSFDFLLKLMSNNRISKAFLMSLFNLEQGDLWPLSMAAKQLCWPVRLLEAGLIRVVFHVPARVLGPNKSRKRRLSFRKAHWWMLAMPKAPLPRRSRRHPSNPTIHWFSYTNFDSTPQPDKHSRVHLSCSVDWCSGIQARSSNVVPAKPVLSRV